MIKRNVLSAMLIISMAAGLFCGCSVGTGNNVGTAAAPNKSETQKQEEIQAKGRYGENNMELPQEEGKSVGDVIQLSDGSLELYLNGDNEVSRYQLSDGVWEKQEKSMLEELGVTSNFHMIYGQDGNRYVSYHEESDYKAHFVKLEEGQPPKELLEEVLSKKGDSGYYEKSPDYYGVTPDGTILMSDRGETTVYNQDGKELFSMPQEWSSMDWRPGGFLFEYTYLTIGDSGFLEYNVKEQSGAARAEYAYQSSSDYGDQFSPVAPDRKGGFFALNQEGIHHINQGGSIWETVVDGKLNSLGMPSANLRKLFVGNEDDFYVWIGTPESDEIKHYVYDPEMPSAPSRTLTVYGLDLSKNDTIRQAASLFQLDNPDIAVELIDGAESSGSTTVSDTIRALNTELLSGNGADVLVLDGLPVESYIEKGILENMKELLKPMIESGELMANVSEPFTEADGGIYQIPARMILLAAYGDQKAIDSLGSLKAIKTYQEDTANKPIRSKTKYENLLRQILCLTYDEVVDTKNNKIVPGKIKELLETVQTVGEANGAKAVFDESEDSGMGYVYNMSFGTTGFLVSDYDRLDRGLSSIAIEAVDGLYCMMMPFSVIKKNQLTLQPVNRSYIPVGMLGINKGGRQTELAREFVLYVLGSKVQGSDLSDGLPVNRKAVDEWMIDKKSSQYSVGVSGADGYSLSGVWPDEKEKTQVFQLAGEADHPILVDRVIMGIIVDETKGFFEGSLSLEQAAQNAENKAKLYFSE